MKKRIDSMKQMARRSRKGFDTASTSSSRPGIEDESRRSLKTRNDRNNRNADDSYAWHVPLNSNPLSTADDMDTIKSNQFV